MKHRSGEPWMPAVAYAHSLRGLTLNLLVRDVARSVAFATDVLCAEVVYSDSDFAVLRAKGSEWMLHADHAYGGHALPALIPSADVRGAGAELRLHGCDPDAAEAAARRNGYNVLAPAAGKPHGLREVYILDPDGYCWVLDRKIGT
jgi:catechol 2,3-dioxygenase-like lactoylglutathione lyase family enzyme